MLEKFMSLLPAKNRNVLDIGCGDGSLYDTYLANHCNIFGIDICEEQIRAARRNVPTGVFVTGNFLEHTFVKKFKGIVCMYALFHFMEEHQKEAIRKMYAILCKGGVALINIRKETTVSIKYNIDWCGKPMYWSLRGIERTLYACSEVGFKYQLFEDVSNNDYAYALLYK